MNIMMARMTPFSLHFARCTDSPCRIEHVKIQCLKDHSSLARTSRWMDSNSGSLWTNAHPTPQIERSGLHEASGSTVYSLCIAFTTRKVRPKPESPRNNASPVEPTLELPTSRQAWEARIQPAFVYQHWKLERQERSQNSHPRAHEG